MNKQEKLIKVDQKGSLIETLKNNKDYKISSIKLNDFKNFTLNEKELLKILSEQENE